MNEHFPKSSSRNPIPTERGEALNGHGRENADPFDALTDLFLGDSGDQGSSGSPAPDSAPTEPHRPVLRLAIDTDPDESHLARPDSGKMAAPARGTGVECLLMGHLPVFASPWVSQYAREAAAAARAPLALLRLQSGYATIEILGDHPNADSPAPAGFEQAVRMAGAFAHGWIVRTDAAEEQDAAGHRAVGTITLLTGADEAAVVGAYRSIKGLSPRIPAKREDAVGRSAGAQPRLRVAVIGAQSSAAHRVSMLLSEASQKFLGRGLECFVSSPRIESSRAPSLLFSGKTGMSIGAVLDLLETIRTAARPAAAVATPRITGPSHAGPFPESPVHAPPRPQDTSAPVSPGLLQRLIPVDADVQAEPVPDAGVLAPCRPSAPAASTAEVPPGALSHHVPGLRPVSIRCPYSPGVEFAIDSTGAPHLLVQPDSEGHDEEAVSSLLVASAWTEKHAQILGDALGRSIERGYRAAPPVLHLFTDRPRDTRRMLETGVRIHLLANVRAGDRTAWYCTPLN